MAKTTQNAPAVARSAKPATKDEKAVKPKKSKPVYSADASIVDDEGKMHTVPSDYDPKKFKPLKRGDFTSESVWYKFRAFLCDLQSQAYLKQAEEAEKLGSAKDRQKAKRLQRLRSQLDELTKELSGQGIDVDAILAAAAGGDDE